MSFKKITDPETLVQAKACLQEVQATLAKYGFVLGHEDSQGAFHLEPVNTMTDRERAMYVAWLDGAYVVAT